MSISIITAGLIPAEERRAKWIFDKTINLHRGEQSRIIQEQKTTATATAVQLYRFEGSKVQLANKQFRATKEALLNTFLTIIKDNFSTPVFSWKGTKQNI